MLIPSGGRGGDPPNNTALALVLAPPDGDGARGVLLVGVVGSVPTPTTPSLFPVSKRSNSATRPVGLGY